MTGRLAASHSCRMVPGPERTQPGGYRRKWFIDITAAVCIPSSEQYMSSTRSIMQNTDPDVESPNPAAQATANMHRRGYPSLADFMSRSPEAAIFRKFRSIALLNILRLQAELQEMETELDEIILEDVTSGNKVRERLSRDFKAMRDFQDTVVPEQQSLQYEQIESIGNKLREYSMLLLPHGHSCMH